MKFKLALLAAMSLSASGAFAQQAMTIYNKGGINNTITTNAVAGTNGFSQSVATGSAQSVGNIKNAITPSASGTTGVNANMSGAVVTKNNGSAFNYSTGTGNGSATSVGWADSEVKGTSTYLNSNVAHQDLKLSGSINATGPNGTDISVIAGKNQAGFANAEHTADFKLDTSMTHASIAGGHDITANLGDVKNSASIASTGLLNVNGLPSGTVLAPATQSANASGTVSVNASFYDPIGQ